MLKWQIQSGFLYLAFILTLYNEFIVYHLGPWQWNQLKDREGIRILTVADPQILGNTNENFINRWDCDRYLDATYRVAKNFFKPDVVLFLGDLMDEGSIATDDQFARYAKRFRKLFLWDSSSKYIFLPGDNDIGGEQDDVFLPSKLERFEKYLSNTSNTLTIDHLEFLPLDRISSRISTPQNCTKNSNVYCIALSHIPVSLYGTGYAREINKRLHPALTLSAHEHSSMIVNPWREPLEMDTVADSTVRTFSVGNKFELVVPTCSYRMGKKQMGFGALVISKHGDISYTVLWSPSRFTSLLVYILFLPILCIFLLLMRVCRILFQRFIVFFS